MKNIFAPLIIGIAMLGVLSVVFGPSSKTRRESHAEQNQRLFNVGFESGAISAVAALQKRGVDVDVNLIEGEAGAWWNSHPHEGWYFTKTNTLSHVAPIDWTNAVIRYWPSGNIKNFSHPLAAGWTNDAAWTNGQVVIQTGNKVDYTALLNVLVADGTFCRVRGHSWGAHAHFTLEHAPGRVGCRECQVCGLHQEQYASEWK